MSHTEENGATTSETPPAALEVLPDGIPEELRLQPRWVNWRWELRQDKKGQAKWTKPPFQAGTDHHASSTDPRTWVPFDVALAAYRRGGYAGIGYALCPDPEQESWIVGIDLDHARDPASGEVAPWAVPILERLRPGAAGAALAHGERRVSGGPPAGSLSEYSL
jgi:primase-polymerase (primpol)-like protein